MQRELELMSDTESKAEDLQAKFELYVVSLTFTLLAFSVQTTTFGEHLVSNILVLLGWLLLLISGITGIIRLYHIPVVLRYYAAKEQQQEVNEKHLKQMESRVSSLLYLWFFISGVVLIILAKAAPPISQIFSYICKTI